MRERESVLVNIEEFQNRVINAIRINGRTKREKKVVLFVYVCVEEIIIKKN